MSKPTKPFLERPDLSPYLIHLTKNTVKDDKYTAYKNLESILLTGRINGSSNEGFIKGNLKAACLMDIPITSLKYLLNKENTRPESPRYEAFGILIGKNRAYNLGCRPVLYLSNEELKSCKIPADELWRAVRFEVNDGQWISWMHEREWRCKNELVLPSTLEAVLVDSPETALRLSKSILESPGEFKTKPKSIIPLDIVCHGLIY